MKTATQCVLSDEDDRFGAISTPIYQTATFRQTSATEFGEYDYSRTANPTRTQLEKKLAELEKGSHAAAFASGMAAITVVTRLLSSGDEVLASDDLYGGSIRLLEKLLPRQGIVVRYVDTADLSAVANSITSRTRLLLTETPSNPQLRIADIAGLADIAHSSSALLAVDNTMMSPCLQQPLKSGADIVIHSATKALSGHSDVTSGAVITADDDLHRQISFIQNAEGTALAPFDSWLLLRGIKTLALRVERQNDNARKVAEYLATRPEIDSLYYPGQPDHPGREIHRRQATGDGSVISFTTGDGARSKSLVESTRVCSITVSFGSVNSSISMPCFMSHASIPESLRSRIGPPGDLVRLSIGIEDVDDIITDLDKAFSAIGASKTIAARG
jgi:cystathionine beta-lyase